MPLADRTPRVPFPPHAALRTALLTALGAFSAPAGAQTLRGEPPPFVLSKAADLAGQDRQFDTRDTLHMWIATPKARAGSLGEAAGGEAVGWWLLASSTESFQGALLPAQNGGLGAIFPLAEVVATDPSFTWFASLERPGAAPSTFTAALTIVSPLPVADFAADRLEGELPLAVRFEDRSSGEVSAWSWDFGDGATSSERSPTHVFATAGEFTVTLTATNPAGSHARVAPAPIVVREPEFALEYGMNASENAWWQRGIAFADAMARASEFTLVVGGTINRELAPLIERDHEVPLAAGWPDPSRMDSDERAGARLFGNMAGSMPDGRVLPYVLTWDGVGSCRLSGPAVVREANRTSNRVEVFVDPTVGGGDSLLIWLEDWSDVADPVRNAHVWLPGMEAEKPILWPPFVEKLKAMNGGRGPSVWRAMDWNEVNQYGRNGGSAPFVFELDERITPASASQGTKRGVCPEYQVALCNAVDTDLHFNVPHQANGISDADYEEFVRDALVRIRDGSPAVPGTNGGRPFEPLAPHLKLILEYSNEIWNSGFPVNNWLKQRAQANGRTLHQQAAHEIRRVFAIAESVFHGPHAPRLQRYVGGWLGDANFLLEILGALGPGVHVDAVGPAAYFGPRKADIDAWMAGAQPGGSCPSCPTPEEVIASARRRIAELDLKLLEHRLVASAHVNPDGSTPRLVLYEAGSSFFAGYQPWGAAANAAQRLPAMYETYVMDFVPALVARGVEGVAWYSFMTDGDAQGTSGPFGHWETMEQSITLPVPEVYVDEGAPKAAAIYRGPPRR